jgi:ubiquinone/menaquinone biosynthesis C-methylase UbiE
MSRRGVVTTVVAVALGGAAVFAATPLGRDLTFHVLPLRWTGEAGRLAAVLRIGPGSAVADVGAGSGALIVELSRIAGSNGRAFASERTASQRAAIASRARGAGVAVTIVEAADDGTSLPDACCDAITMRMVMHHIADPPAFARDVRRALRPGGRVGIIDFAPGALPHLAADHGVSAAQVIAQFGTAGFEVADRNDHWGGGNYLIVLRAR